MAGVRFPSANGVLFKYGEMPAHVAFKCGHHPQKLVLVGGLTDGFFFAPYWVPLSEELDKSGWSLVQPQLSSSCTGWGISSLDQDAKELVMLLDYLRNDGETKDAVLMGHSTGCQDAVRLTQNLAAGPASGHSPLAGMLKGVILQAPVSDREWMMQDEEVMRHLEQANAMIESGRGDQILLRYDAFDGAPLTAARYHALVAKGGDDDMFSNDLTDAELQALLRHMGRWPCMFLISGDEQYVPPNVDVTALAHRLAAATQATTSVTVIPGASHSLQGFEAEAVKAIMGFLQTLPGA